MAMIGRNSEMTWIEVLGMVQALVGHGLLVVSGSGLAERPEEFVYARLQQDNPHRYVLKRREIWSVGDDGHPAVCMWTLRPEPVRWCMAKGQVGPCEWSLEDDDRITFRLWSSKAVYRLVRKGEEYVPVLVYKAGPAWCFESDSLCWQHADRLAERVTRERRLAAAERAA